MKTFRSNPALIASLLSFLSLAGCRGGDAPITARADRYDPPWLTVGSQQLRVDTVVREPTVVRDESGILRLTVPIRSTTDLQLYIDYRVTFRDANGQEVNAVTGNLTIPQRGTRAIAANSTSPRAETFQVELYYPRVN